MTQYTDRSRYLAGHRCEWERLLNYHAFGTGLSRLAQVAPLATGIAIHSALEAILRAWKDPAAHSNSPKFDYPAIIGPSVDAYREIVTHRGLEGYASDEAWDQVALAEALPLAYARVCEDWFKEEFDLLSIEEEMPHPVNDSLTWMTRSDFVTYVKTLGTHAVHDFKSASSWYPDNETQWRDNLQMMVNGYVAGKKLGVPVTHYYIHILVKGNKRSPSPIVKPWYQPANPPMQIEDFRFKYKTVDPNSGKNIYTPKSYQRTPVRDIVGDDNVGKFVMETVPLDALRDSIIVIGPFGIDNAKVEKFLRGLPWHEQRWQARMERIEDEWLSKEGFPLAAGPLDTLWTTQWPKRDFQNFLDEQFPRTYDCFKFGGQKCGYYNLCHEQPGWDNPLGNGEYEARTPHHTTEEI